MFSKKRLLLILNQFILTVPILILLNISPVSAAESPLMGCSEITVPQNYLSIIKTYATTNNFVNKLYPNVNQYVEKPVNQLIYQDISNDKYYYVISHDTAATLNQYNLPAPLNTVPVINFSLGNSTYYTIKIEVDAEFNPIAHTITNGIPGADNYIKCIEGIAITKLNQITNVAYDWRPILPYFYMPTISPDDENIAYVQTKNLITPQPTESDTIVDMAALELLIVKYLALGLALFTAYKFAQMFVYRDKL